MQITVVPASTKTGQAIIENLLAADSGPTVHAVYRNLDKVPSHFASHSNFKAVKGDVNDASSLDFSGSDAVVAITPPTYDDTDIMQHARKVSENTKEAVTKAGSVKRLVLLSSVGAQFDHDVGEIKTNNMAEQILRDAAPEVVFVRCTYFMENWGMGIETVLTDEPFFFSTVTPLDFKFSMVSIMDIGKALAAQALATGSSLPVNPHIFELHGPRGYTSYDVQGAFEKAVGKKVEVRPIEKEGLSEFYAQVFPPNAVKEWVEMNVSFLPGGILDKNQAREQDIVRGQVELDDAIKTMLGGQ